MPVDVVLFDLGGVLSNFVGVERMRRLARISTDDDVRQRWLASEWIRRYECGGCTPEDFAAGIVAEWQLAMTADQFLAEFAEWVVAPYDGAEDLVREVAGVVPVGCLSNMNRIHWDRTISRWPLSRMFRFIFLSFDMGVVKPDAHVFRHVVGELRVPPSSVLFLDDNATNVAAAERAGLRAVQTRGVAEARAALQMTGVLPGP